MCRNHRFQHDCNSSPIYIGNPGNLAVMRKFQIKLALGSKAFVHSADLFTLAESLRMRFGCPLALPA
jgi:hypothetical protein